ncbi:hypothetical protein [Maridesulfovibrio frigidus]|uniref:hypothetical protein n=1 Tax=Maridesulfovibrio frigidus TaxID=340956 RepID=UPI0004E2842A|nr:hypothetical protein [Maridesulfovibrio frigidus]
MYGFEVDGGFVFYKYRDLDGTLSLTEGHLKWFWDVMSQAGHIPTVFYDGSVECFEEFKKLANDKGQHFFFGFKGNKPSGMFWVNGLAHRSCFVHLAIMPGFYREGTLKMGKGVLRHLLTARDVAGRYVMDCIKGLIPSCNPLACQMAEKSGFSKIGIIPQATYFAAEDKSVDAVIFCAVRNSQDKQLS